jgi:hypothetical protein
MRRSDCVRCNENCDEQRREPRLIYYSYALRSALHNRVDSGQFKRRGRGPSEFV